MKLFLSIPAILLAANFIRADIYVNNQTGNDLNSGKSADQALKTLASGMKKVYPSGDSKLVLAKTSSPYFESLIITGGGTAARPLVIEGNGAVISGLKLIPAEKWQPQKELYFYPHPRFGALRPYLVVNGKEVPRGGRNLKSLKPFSHYWTKQGVYFKPETGKTIKDYSIWGTLRVSGVTITNSSYIVCRNLISEFFANDGFNIHGNCQFMLFENITGRYNGDDGFSVHDNVSAIVRNAYFHHNDFGIQDVHASSSEFYGILVENNRRIGVNFSGGVHALINATVRNNQDGQIKIKGGNAPHIGFDKQDPIMTGFSVLKDVSISGERYGLLTDGEAKTVVMNCVIGNTPIGICCERKSQTVLSGVIIRECTNAVIINNDCPLKIDYSIIAPGTYKFGDKSFPADKFADWSKNCKIGKNVLIEKWDMKKDAHIFSSGRVKVTAGLTMPQVNFDSDKK